MGWALTPFLGLQVRSAYGDATMWMCVAAVGVVAGILGLVAARGHDARRRCNRIARVKGLIAAGGNATRLEELTRVTNKHLLPVGRWPMVYYPLQLLQRAGVREVLIVTGQQHAGQFIDLLGNGHVKTRSGDEHLFDLDLAYKVQVEAGGIAQVVGMARDFAAGEQLVVCLGDNIFEYAQAEAISSWQDGRVVFAKDVPDPENFGVVVYDDDGNVSDIVEKAGVVDMRYDKPPSNDAVVGLYCYPPDVFDIIEGLAPSNRGELEITDVNRVYAQRGDLAVRRVEGWWHDGGKHWADLADIGRAIEETGANKYRSIAHPAAAARRRSRLVHGADARERAAEAGAPGEPRALAEGRDPRAALPRARPGRSLPLPAGDGARRRARPRHAARRTRRTSATTTPSRSTCPARRRTATRRSPTACSVTS